MKPRLTGQERRNAPAVENSHHRDDFSDASMNDLAIGSHAAMRIAGHQSQPLGHARRSRQ